MITISTEPQQLNLQHHLGGAVKRKRWCVASPEVEFELVGPCSMNAVLRPYSTELLRYAPEWEGELPDIWRGGGGRKGGDSLQRTA